jgi:hypothetical protein
MPHYDLDGRLVILSRLPELLGGVHGDTDTRYRIYTQDFLPWGALPLWEDGGPQTIALTEWTVQYLVVGFTSCDEPGYDTADLELYIHREVPCRHSRYDYGHTWRYPCTTTEYHPLSGTRWSGRSAARGAVYERGLIGLKVMERDAPGYGFRPEAA